MTTRLQEQRREERNALVAGLDPAVKAGIEVGLELATETMTDRISQAVQASLGATISSAIKDSLVDTQHHIAVLSAWRTDLDSRVSELQEVVLQMQRGSTAQAAGESAAAHLAAPPSTYVGVDHASAAGATHGPVGHGYVFTHRARRTRSQVTQQCL